MQEYIDFFQQNTLMCLAWLGIFAALIFNIFKSATAKFTFVSVNELTQLVNKENGLVIDIRSKDDFTKGHITDSIHILASDIKAGNLSGVESHKVDPIIVVCRAGQTAQAAADDLVKAGFEKVNVLTNGITAWNEANLPLVRGRK
jgi:rhodanese-related sulfurtransferase